MTAPQITTKPPRTAPTMAPIFGDAVVSSNVVVNADEVVGTIDVTFVGVTLGVTFVGVTVDSTEPAAADVDFDDDEDDEDDDSTVVVGTSAVGKA